MWTARRPKSCGLWVTGPQMVRATEFIEGIYNLSPADHGNPGGTAERWHLVGRSGSELLLCPREAWPGTRLYAYSRVEYASGKVAGPSAAGQRYAHARREPCRQIWGGHLELVAGSRFRGHSFVIPMFLDLSPGGRTLPSSHWPLMLGRAKDVRRWHGCREESRSCDSSRREQACGLVTTGVGNEAVCLSVRTTIHTRCIVPAPPVHGNRAHLLLLSSHLSCLCLLHDGLPNLVGCHRARRLLQQGPSASDMCLPSNSEQTGRSRWS